MGPAEPAKQLAKGRLVRVVLPRPQVEADVVYVYGGLALVDFVAAQAVAVLITEVPGVEPRERITDGPEVPVAARWTTATGSCRHWPCKKDRNDNGRGADKNTNNLSAHLSTPLCETSAR